MKNVHVTGLALAALLVTACGASSRHASAPERAAQRAAEDKEQAQEDARTAALDADKARYVPHTGVGVTERQADNRVKVVLFAPGKADLSANARSRLDDLSKALRAQPKADNVIVDGYTDDTGAEKNNAQLSRRRAEEVADYLASKGVARELITTKALGSRNPAKAGVDEPPALKETLNRRVEIVISPR